MKKKIYLIALIISTIISCKTNSKPEKFDYGKVENHVYINDFFNLQVSIPAEWVVQTKELTKKIIKRAEDIASGDNKNLKAIIKASEINSAYLLTVFKYEIGSGQLLIIILALC